MAAYDWILGLALMFGMAFILTMLLTKELNTKVFLVFLTMFNAFSVWAGLLDLWTLILNLIILSGFLYMEFRRGGFS